MINCVFSEFFYCFEIPVLYLIQSSFPGCNIHVRHSYFEIIWINAKFFSLTGSDRWRSPTNVRRPNVRRRLTPTPLPLPPVLHNGRTLPLPPQYSVTDVHYCLERREATLCYCLCRSNVCSLSSRVVPPSHCEDQSTQPWAILHFYRYSWCHVIDHMQSWVCLVNTWICHRLHLMLTSLGLYIYFFVHYFNHKTLV